MNLTHQTGRQSAEIAGGKGKAITPVISWIFQPSWLIALSGALSHAGRGSLALLLGLALVNQPPQVLHDGRWLRADHLPVCSFYVNVIGWRVGRLQKLLLKCSYHLVQVGGGGITVGFHTTANNSAWLSSSYLVELIWYFMVEAIARDHSHSRLAGEGLKLGNIPWRQWL